MILIIKKLFVINKTRFEIYLASVIIAAQFPGSDKSFCKDLSSKNVNNLLAEVLDYIGALIRMQSYVEDYPEFKDLFISGPIVYNTCTWC